MQHNVRITFALAAAASLLLAAPAVAKTKPKHWVDPSTVYRAPVKTHNYAKDPKGPYKITGGWVGNANSPLTDGRKPRRP